MIEETRPTSTKRQHLQLLDQAAGSREVVQVGIRLALGADEAAEGEGGGLASVLAIGIDVADVDLHGRVVGSGDDAVGGGAANTD